MNIINLFASSNYLVVNKDLIKRIGLKETIILSELASEYQYYLENKEDELKENDGYFYSTVDNIENRTSIKKDAQITCINNLEQLGIIKTKYLGIPRKRYFKVDTFKILSMFEMPTTSCLENSSSAVGKTDDLQSEKPTERIIIKNNNKDISSISESEFEELWSYYPKKKGKASALKKYIQYRSKDNELYDKVKNGIVEYGKEYFRNHSNNDLTYMKDGSTFFNNKVWEDYETKIAVNNIKEVINDNTENGEWQEFDYSKFGF